MEEKIYLVADDINGIKKVESFDGYHDIDIVDSDTFIDTISTFLDEPIYIAAIFDEKQYKRLLDIGFTVTC